MMPNLPSEDMGTVLNTAGVATLGSTLFIGKQPDSLPTTNAIVVLYDTGGFNPDATGKVFDRPTIQVRVIGPDGGFVVARNLAQAIKAALHQRTPGTVGGSTYKGIWQMGEIAFAGYEGDNCPVFTVNFRIHRTY